MCGYEKEERKRKRKKSQAPTLGEIRPVLRVGGVSEGRAVSARESPHLPRERLRRGRFGRSHRTASLESLRGGMGQSAGITRCARPVWP